MATKPATMGVLTGLSYDRVIQMDRNESLIAAPFEGINDATANYDSLLSVLYDGVQAEQGFNPFLQRLQQLFGCRTATLSVRDSHTGQVVGGWYQDMPADIVAWYIAEMAWRDPLYLRAVDQNEVGFCSAHISNDVSMDDPVITEWCAQAGLVDGACAIVHRDQDTFTALTLGRAEEYGRFSMAELAVYNQLIAHVRRALGLRKLVQQQQSATALLVDALQTLASPIVMLDGTMNILFSNRAAEQWLQGNPWIQRQQSVLRFLSHRRQSAFIEAIHTLTCQTDSDGQKQDLAQVVMTLEAPTGINTGGATLLFAPVYRHRPEDGPAVMLTIYPWDANGLITRERIQQFFDVSDAEARVCEGLCQGCSLEEISAQLCREMSTIRTHVKSLYRKTSTNRQAELVAHVLTSLLRPGSELAGLSVPG